MVTVENAFDPYVQPICVACERQADLVVRPPQPTLWRTLGPVVKATGATAMLCPSCQDQGNATPRVELRDVPE